MKEHDLVAWAKAEHEHILKAERLGKLKEPVGHAQITNQAGVVTVSMIGFVSFYMYEELSQAVELAGDDLKAVIVKINSMGGSAFAGVAIGNYLRSLKAKVTTMNESAAMSAAAVIFMGGDERLMGENGSTLLFHHAMGWLDILEHGNRDVLAEVDTEAPKAQALDMLDALDEIILGVMTKGTKLTEAKAKALMKDSKTKDGKTINGKDAVAYGLATGFAAADKGGDDKEDGAEEAPEDHRAEDIELMAQAGAILIHAEQEGI